MARLLSPEWCEATDALLAEDPPPIDGDVGVHVAVSGGPDGDVKLGDPATAELTLTVPAAEVAAIVDGSLDPNVAFMQGRLKSSGDTGVLFRLLAWTRTPAFAELRAAVAATTDA